MSQKSWVEFWLSRDRWHRYLQACHGAPELALELYELNLLVAGAIMHDIAHIEVAVRNVYDHTISASWPGRKHWLLDPDSPVNAPLLRRRAGRTVDLNARNRASIREATRRNRTGSITPGALIAELPFGFWRHLTDTAHEKTLWVPHLHTAFPKGTSRKHVEQCLTLLNTVRNRASHHEPLFTTAHRDTVIRAHNFTLWLSQQILPPLAIHIEQTSTVIAELDALNRLSPQN